jgi:hypothetical protein
MCRCIVDIGDQPVDPPGLDLPQEECGRTGDARKAGDSSHAGSSRRPDYLHTDRQSGPSCKVHKGIKAEFVAPRAHEIVEARLSDPEPLVGVERFCSQSRTVAVERWKRSANLPCESFILPANRSNVDLLSAD